MSWRRRPSPSSFPPCASAPSSTATAAFARRRRWRLRSASARGPSSPSVSRRPVTRPRPHAPATTRARRRHWACCSTPSSSTRSRPMPSGSTESTCCSRRCRRAVPHRMGCDLWSYCCCTRRVIWPISLRGRASCCHRECAGSSAPLAGRGTQRRIFSGSSCFTRSTRRASWRRDTTMCARNGRPSSASSRSSSGPHRRRKGAPRHIDTDVLVVGAGPTGLMLANQLARRGVRVRIIDRHAGPARESRALGVQGRTLEIYSHLGLADQAVALGKRADGAVLWAEGRRAARVPLGDIGRDVSPYPYLLVLGQDDNERLLGDALRARGLAVQWNTELAGLAQDTDQVTATLKSPDGSKSEVTVPWLAGCDGARSTVRELSGIPFEGAPYQHVFFVADVQMTGSMAPDILNVYLWRRGFHLVFPMRGTDHWRIVGILPPHLRGRDDLTFEETIPTLRHDVGTELSFQACNWFSTYRIHHRRAARFHDRRCFLLGDAAHVHSPVGGQGMNTGLQDAYNLAWKLALVVSGRAGAALVHSYEDERLPVANHLLKRTDRLFSIVVSDSWLAGLIRTRVMPKVMGLALRTAAVQRIAFRTISQTGIRYRSSPLSEALAGLPEDGPRAGDRFPWLRLNFAPRGPTEDLFEKLDDTRFNLLVIGQRPPAGGIPELGDLLRMHEVPSDSANDRELARVRIPRPSFYLLRPDGHVGLAGVPLDAGAVSRYVSERLRFG